MCFTNYYDNNKFNYRNIKIMIKKLLFILTAAVVLFGSCRKDFIIDQQQQSRVVLFTSKISGQVQTRVSGSSWDNGDSISIFMYEGNTLHLGSIFKGGFNRHFISNSSGNFSPRTGSDSIVFPVGKAANFVGFYPYQETDQLVMKLDISSQENLAGIDYLYGKNSKATNLTSGPVPLVFERIMSKIQVRIPSQGEGVTAKLHGLSTAGSFDLGKGELSVSGGSKEVLGKVVQSGSEAVIEWVIFPGRLQEQSKIVFQNQQGETFTWEIGKQAISFERGNRYQYTINLSGSGVVDPQPNVSYMEIPVISNAGKLEYKFKMTPDGSKRNFSMLYDTENRLAYWVAYPLSRSYLGGQSRTDDWGYDPDFSYGFQPYLKKGFGITGIDRGHQLPSADRTKNYAENATTFYYTNMTAQEATLNQGVWAKLEGKVREWATSNGVDTMYVVTGALIKTKTDSRIEYVQDNNQKQVAKPKSYFKALAVKRGTEYYTIGYYMKNEVTQTNALISSYRMTVSDLEKETGYTFFPGLAEEKKKTINNAIWN